jgi:hypothetical protein
MSINQFRRGLSRLYDDYVISLHIREAERTRQFLRRRMLQEEEDRGGGGVRRRLHPSTYLVKRRITSPIMPNRRSSEHIRQISRDLSISLPTAAAFVLVPFVGYAFVFLGMAFPRLLLSRQFHTEEQRYDFGTLEYQRRLIWYERLSFGDFWGWCMMNVPKLEYVRGDRDGMAAGEDGEDGRGLRRINSLTYLEMDAAGPVFDDGSMHALCDMIRRNVGRGRSSYDDGWGGEDGGELTTSAMMRNLQSSHLHHLSLSNNIGSRILLPHMLVPYFLQTCTPRTYLERRLTTLAEDMILDDAALIEESHHSSSIGNDGGRYCVGMTDMEVFDACWIRGLPVGRFATADYRDVKDDCDARDGGDKGVNVAIRRILANHLRMMEAIMSVGRGPTLTTTGTVVPEGDEGADAMGPLRPRGELVRDTTLHLLVLHLPSIRYGLRRKGGNQSLTT